MNADKRNVHTDALETLGTVIGECEARDAIHLAVEPVIAAQSLRPGEDVGFVDGGVGICSSPVGIVDPFLKGYVKKGERFWLVVYPRQITSLRHVWTHPAFASNAFIDIGHSPSVEPIVSPSPAKEQAEKYIRALADMTGLGYYELMAKVEDFCKYGGDYSDEYLHFNGSDAHGEIPAEFWTHFEVLTGLKPEGKKPEYFSCSC